MKPASPLLSIRNLRVGFGTPGREVPAVEDVSFDVFPGELVGIVGESGSGKSVSALSIMGLLPEPPARVRGEIWFEGRNLLAMPKAELRSIRGSQIGMIFQEPMTSLNPVFSIGDQITEAVRAHESIGMRAARSRAVDLLAKVGIPSPRRRLDEYPHQLSGGMRQRVMIAIALACSPRLLLADEPTTALDVTIQAQLLDLLQDLQREFGMAIVLITHNMGVIAEFADRVIVMYAGRMVEQAAVFDLFDRPQHPYTAGLLASTPDMQRHQRRLTTIPGGLPGPDERPAGCLFAPRCGKFISACSAEPPPLIELAGSQKAACIRAPALAGEQPA